MLISSALGCGRLQSMDSIGEYHRPALTKREPSARLTPRETAPGWIWSLGTSRQGAAVVACPPEGLRLRNEREEGYVFPAVIYLPCTLPLYS